MSIVVSARHASLRRWARLGQSSLIARAALANSANLRRCRSAGPGSRQRPPSPRRHARRNGRARPRGSRATDRESTSAGHRLCLLPGGGHLVERLDQPPPDDELVRALLGCMRHCRCRPLVVVSCFSLTGRSAVDHDHPRHHDVRHRSRPGSALPDRYCRHSPPARWQPAAVCSSVCGGITSRTIRCQLTPDTNTVRRSSEGNPSNLIVAPATTIRSGASSQIDRTERHPVDRPAVAVRYRRSAREIRRAGWSSVATTHHPRRPSTRPSASVPTAAQCARTCPIRRCRR